MIAKSPEARDEDLIRAEEWLEALVSALQYEGISI